LGKGVERGANIRLRGEDIRRSEHLLPKGAKVDARKVALLAAQGMTGVEVQSRPRVAVVSSGSELCQSGEALGIANTFDCNRPMLMALAVQAGAEVVDGGCCKDDVRTLSRIVSRLSECNDFIVLSGGSSLGEGDVTSSARTHAGAVVEELKIAMKPGKPAVVGTLRETSILGLPGNPLAAFVSWFVLGRSMMAAMFGLQLPILRGRDLAVLNGLQRRPGRVEFVPAKLARTTHGEMVEFLSGGSGRLSPLSRAEGLACIEAARGSVLVSDRVTFVPFEDSEPL
jgi:molybdopterin molybdotransferase